MKPSIRERVVRLEARRGIREREEIPVFNITVLTEDQRDQLRDAALMVAASRKELIRITDEHLCFIRETDQLLRSCPPYLKVKQ